MGADLFNIGRTSLHASKKALSTTSHNIANANTEGYSRQRVTTETNTPIAEGSYVLGTGTRVAGIKRVHDKLIQKKLNHSTTSNNFHEQRTFQLERVEEIFNEINSDGLNKILNKFFNSFRELSNQPENETVRAMVRDNAKLVVNDFKRIDKHITDVKESINRKIHGSVEEINILAESITSLNKEITRLETLGGETGDLRDQRDQAVLKISEMLKVNTYEDKKGQYVVNIVGAGSLVAGGVINKLEAKAVTDGNAQDAGQMQITFKGRKNTFVTNSITDGSLGALIKTRNEEIDLLKNKVDDIAYGLVKSTNAIHKRGYINRKIPVDQNGNPIENSQTGKITNINFFKDLDMKKNASRDINLDQLIEDDLNNISTGLAPNSPGDNRIAIAISRLQHEKILGEETTTFEEAYLTAVGKIGTAAGKSKIDEEQAKGILAQAKSIKERLAGVSIDEEAANMVKYQHAYDASARVIRVADEMFDSVLDMVR
ncbi:MAG: flagellar hook-associated protein FlgK [Bacteriovoracaceae bacterium]|nr:flagellar hook-associated protein FlgK [Bacteriovoracaceae bacterium]